MITAEIRINTQLIGNIYCVRKTATDMDWCEYSYEYYKPGHGLIQGLVKHYQPNGAIALFKEICEDIETKGGK